MFRTLSLLMIAILVKSNNQYISQQDSPIIPSKLSGFMLLKY